MSSFIPYAKQSISQEDIEQMTIALKGETITRGNHVEKFEKALSDYSGVKYAVAFNSGSTALDAACYAADVGVNDRIVTTPNTFVSTVGSAIKHKATPLFIDIDSTSGNLDLEMLELNVNVKSSRGKTIVMPVHFAGIPVDVAAIDRMINNPDTIIIEDAAHAIGSSYKSGKKVGSCESSHMTIFSFHPAKTITTGEGGAVTTNDDHFYKKLILYRNNGIVREKSSKPGAFPGYYEVHDITGNFNFTDFQAALGLSQLNRIDQFVNKRRELTKHYRKLLKSLPHVKMFTAEYDSTTAFHLCVVQIDFSAYKTKRDTVMRKLQEMGIGTQVHYIPVYRHPYFVERFGELDSYLPVMEGYFSQALTLPLYYDLTLQDVERVVNGLKKALK